MIPFLLCKAVTFQSPSVPVRGHSVHVPVDLLQQRVQRGVRLRPLDDLHQLGVLGDQLPEVRHLLKKFREEKGVVRVVTLQVESEHVHDALLHSLDLPDVQEARAIYPQRKEETPEW